MKILWWLVSLTVGVECSSVEFSKFKKNRCRNFFLNCFFLKAQLYISYVTDLVIKTYFRGNATVSRNTKTPLAPPPEPISPHWHCGVHFHLGLPIFLYSLHNQYPTSPSLYLHPTIITSMRYVPNRSFSHLQHVYPNGSNLVLPHLISS